MSSLRSTAWFVEGASNGMWPRRSGPRTKKKEVNTLDNMFIKMSSLSASTPLSFYETTQRDYSIKSFIATYQNELPQLVMIKNGHLGDIDSNSLATGQVLRIHGIHSECRVLAKVTKDSRNCFGYGSVTLSIPVTCPIPMCRVKKSGSSKTANLLKTIIKRHTLPMTVQLMATARHDIQLTGKMVLLTGDVRLRLLKEYEEKYIYGNPVKTGEVFENVISVPSCEPIIRLTVVLGLASHNDEHWQSILELMDHTVTNYIKFDGKLCNTEIFDCSSPDLKIEKLADETFTEPDNKHFSGPKEKALDETFTESDNKHSSGPKEKALGETFTESDNKHSSGPKEKELGETFTESNNKHSSGSQEKALGETFTEPDNRRSLGPNVKALVETFTEPGNKHSSGPEEKALGETYTESDNKHYSGPKEKELGETFTEPQNKRSSGPKEKALGETFTEPQNTHSSGPKEKALGETYIEPGNKRSSCHKEKALDETYTEPQNKHSSCHKEKELGETFTEPDNRCSLGPKVKVLVETFTEPGNKHSAGPKEKALDETYTEPQNTHSSGHKVKPEDATTLSEDDHIYHEIPNEYYEAKNQSSYQDSLLFGNNDDTISFSPGHVLSNCNIGSTSKKNPDPGNSMLYESDSLYNQKYEKHFSMKLPSTQKSEEMVAVGKPTAPKIRSPDIGGLHDIKMVKPVNSSFDIYSLSVQDLGKYLHILNIGRHAGKLSDAQIDGTLLKELNDQILIEEFGFKQFEALTLMMFARHGYLPKICKRQEP